MTPLPSQAGIGLQSQHYKQILELKPAIAWLEVHSENYFAEGGQPLAILTQIRQHYPLSLHGVGLSLGSVDSLNLGHLTKLKRLMQQVEPVLVSEHLSWGALDGRHYNDLLPLPYTQEALAHMIERVNQTQDYLGRQILIENISSYTQFIDSCIPEGEFIAELARQTSCGILLDVNNIYVSAYNLGFNPNVYWQAIPAESILEIHLAGHSRDTIAEQTVLIDTHDQPITAEVWQLYQQIITSIGPKPTLIEWDANLPELAVLLAEANKASTLLHELIPV